MVTVKIIPRDATSPARKLADAELHFQAGPLKGMKLIGFTVWEHPNGVDLRVGFPSRSVTVHGGHIGELLCPVGARSSRQVVRELILDALFAYTPEA